jgi:hypothetical protein
MIKLSYSGIKDYQACPRRYYLSRVLKRVLRKTSDALRIGTAWHIAAEAYLLHGYDAACKALADASAQLDEVDAAKLAAMLRHYYLNAMESAEVVATEQPFEMRIKCPDTGRGLNGVVLRGFIDALIRDDSGELAVLEHKTTSSKDIMHGGEYWRAKQIDHQHPWYRLAAGADYAVYDVVRKPSLKPSSKDGKKNGDEITPDVIEAYHKRVCADIEANADTYYGEHEYRLTDDELADAQRDLYQWARKIREAHKRDEWPRNPGSCEQYSGCPYLGVCTGTASIDDDAVFADKEDR